MTSHNHEKIAVPSLAAAKSVNQLFTFAPNLFFRYDVDTDINFATSPNPEDQIDQWISKATENRSARKEKGNAATAKTVLGCLATCVRARHVRVTWPILRGQFPATVALDVSIISFKLMGPFDVIIECATYGYKETVHKRWEQVLHRFGADFLRAVRKDRVLLIFFLSDAFFPD